MGAFRLAKYLRKKGNAVRIVTTEKHRLSGAEPGGFEVLRLPHRFGASDRAALRRVLRREFEQADVVHSRYCYRLAAWSGPLARELSRRFVVSLHGLGLLDNPQDGWLRRWSHRRYRRISLSLADAVIATSTEFGRLAGRYAEPSRIAVIPNGVDTDEFDPARPVPAPLAAKYGSDPVVLAVRRLVPKNGVHYLVQAAPRILRACPQARFVIAGWGSQEADLKDQASHLGIASRFDFAGAVPNRDIHGYLSVAKVVVFPSSMESTSHACLEAMAMGKPVVASRLGGLEELIGGDGSRGVLVDLFDSNESTYVAPPSLTEDASNRLAEGVIALLEEPERAKALGEAGRRYVLEHFDWNVMVERILRVYRGEPAPSSA